MKEKHHALLTARRDCFSRASLIKAWPGELLRWIGLFPLLRIFTHPKTRGREQVTGKGPYIFVANHTSHLDAPLLLAVLPLRLRLRLRTAAASDYFFRSWWKGAFVRLLFNAFSFERKGFAGLDCAQQFLKRGYSILLFPEGTRSKDGQVQPFKCGIGRLVLNTHVCVIPVWIEGAYAAMPRGRHIARCHSVEIHFGAPLQFARDLDLAGVVTMIERQVGLLAPLVERQKEKDANGCKKI